MGPRAGLHVLEKRKTLVPAEIKYYWHTIRCDQSYWHTIRCDQSYWHTIRCDQTYWHTIRCDQSWIGGTGGTLQYEVFENIILITCSIGERIQKKYVCETRSVFSNIQCHSHVYCILPPTHTQRFLVACFNNCNKLYSIQIMLALGLNRCSKIIIIFI